MVEIIRLEPTVNTLVIPEFNRNLCSEIIVKDVSTNAIKLSYKIL